LTIYYFNLYHNNIQSCFRIALNFHCNYISWLNKVRFIQIIGETQAGRGVHESVTVYFSSLKSCLKTIVHNTLYHFINRSLKVFKTITVILKLSQKIETDKIKLLFSVGKSFMYNFLYFLLKFKQLYITYFSIFRKQNFSQKPTCL
jgi:hypothetical protein